MKKILFVCLGNICRSPGAEAIMKAWIKKEGKEKEFLIDSAGLYSGHAGALPDERMRRHASRRGYVLDSRARTFYPTADFAEFDMIIGMDDQNIEALKRAAINEEERAKIFKMTDFCRKSTSYSPRIRAGARFIGRCGCRTLLVLFGPLLIRISENFTV